MPAPPPYGSSSTCPARSGVVSRYEKSRRSSSVPRTDATGRCSVSHANACGTRVKTSSCTGRALRLARLYETGRDDDASGLEIVFADALPHHRQREAGVELENVVRHTGRHVRNRSQLSAALLLHPPPDDLEDVVLA